MLISMTQTSINEIKSSVCFSFLSISTVGKFSLKHDTNDFRFLANVKQKPLDRKQEVILVKDNF